ncbi:MAG: acyltransferase [Alphaproteobacteria bacterium]
MYLANIHNFRTVAIMGIVGAHSLHNFDWSGGEILFRSFDALFNESSIWFFFIAGFLFQYLSRNFKAADYYLTKIKNVITPYLILSIPALVASLTFVDQEMPAGFENKHLVEQIFLFLITGKHLAPFWFVPTISIIYLFAPVLIAADRSRWPYFALPVLLVMSALLGRDGFLELTGLGGYFSPVSKAIYLFSVYFFGMFCSQFRAVIAKKIIVWHWPLLVLAVPAYLAAVMFPDATIKYIFVFKVISAVLLVYYLDLSGKDMFAKISYVGTASFGIFFVHGYFLQIIKIAMQYFTGAELFTGHIISLIVFIAAVTAASCLALWITQRALGKNSRLVVGV